MMIYGWNRDNDMSAIIVFIASDYDGLLILEWKVCFCFINIQWIVSSLMRCTISTELHQSFRTNTLGFDNFSISASRRLRSSSNFSFLFWSNIPVAMRMGMEMEMEIEMEMENVPSDFSNGVKDDSVSNLLIITIDVVPLRLQCM